MTYCVALRLNSGMIFASDSRTNAGVDQIATFGKMRVYEQKGLLTPHRTRGGTRRYSGNDVDTIAEITTLLAAGLNLAGVDHVLQLRSETRRLQDELDRIRADAGESEGAPPPAGSPQPG